MRFALPVHDAKPGGWKPEPRSHPDTWAGKRFRDPPRSRPYKTYETGFCGFCRVGNSTYAENLRSFGSTQRPNTLAPTPSPRAQSAAASSTPAQVALSTRQHPAQHLELGTMPG